MKHLLLLASFAIFGCSTGSDEDDEQAVLRDSASAPMEKAEAVEGMILESRDRVDESVDAADE